MTAPGSPLSDSTEPRPAQAALRLARPRAATRRPQSGAAPGYLLRPAEARGALRIAAILSDWIDATEWMPRIHSRADDREHAAHIIAQMDVRVICRRRLLRPALVVGFLARRAHFIHALYLAPEARGRGLGSALIEDAKAESPHLELWCFQANHPARAFYGARGFEVVEIGDGSGNDEKLPDLRLTWSRA